MIINVYDIKDPNKLSTYLSEKVNGFRIITHQENGEDVASPDTGHISWTNTGLCEVVCSDNIDRQLIELHIQQFKVGELNR
jgi:hypothetical protein